ncbi:MAG: type II secretion system protein [Betaproteobacteria bacterium]|nr:type II secretion system protein [Betaproteobacteria bacterium]MBI2510180.1 type II secretion system protein [Betaproteobacteria bacterium]
MRDPGRRGFTIFELAVAIVIFSALATVLLNRLNFYQEMAEKAKMESELRTIKTGLQIKLAELIVTNRQAEASKLETEDPVRWLDDKPPNYGGSYRSPPEAGAWYFDAPERQLVYVVNVGNRLDLAGPGPKELRFQARLVKDRVQAAGGPVEGVSGVTLAPVRPYRWSGLEGWGILPRVLQPDQRDAYAIS